MKIPLALPGLCTLDPPLSPPSTLEDNSPRNGSPRVLKFCIDY